MNTFDRLPYDVSLIITYAAEWVSLESLMEVSQRVGWLFDGGPDVEADREAIRLVECILEDNPMMNHKLHHKFRICMHLRQPSYDKNFKKFKRWDYKKSSLTSTSSISRGSLRDTVIVAANIQRLACACLTTYLNRTRELQPRFLEKFGAVIRDAGPASWVEEYRVYESLWHYQLACDLVDATSRLEWSTKDINHLRQWLSESVSRILYEDGYILDSVVDCLEDMCHVPLLDIPTSLSLLEWKTYRSYFLDRLPQASQLRCEYAVWAPPVPPVIAEDDRGPINPWGRDPRSYRTTNVPTTWAARKYGLSLWDRWRLYCLGL
ncbi:hypothetical protein BO79DRAFT_254318 [Aspergillus costaricaensis CBS 115574]|uniref:Uncharacterized protein n=1 Tax=Aspergillus costaricaensis CBS 115574 TaxID=1448317 RepID=A0ACD1IH59_9EURO|nr:hypothetical protein BO79DRAFT_254318 [Aspergillus costaricaensis CBS 115574]RAK89573.1 hypothetical protein BO79DRAFT_254318 [Aspergillus costaricaensis CBS 115574]